MSTTMPYYYTSAPSRNLIYIYRSNTLNAILYYFEITYLFTFVGLHCYNKINAARCSWKIALPIKSHLVTGRDKKFYKILHGQFSLYSCKRYCYYTFDAYVIWEQHGQLCPVNVGGSAGRRRRRWWGGRRRGARRTAASW